MKNIMDKIKNMMARGVVSLIEGQGYQVTLLDGETRSNLEHLQEFGLASTKPDGIKGNGICCFYGGNRGNGSLLVMEFPTVKPPTDAGETVLYNAFDAAVKLNKASEVELDGTVVKLKGTSNLGIIKIVELTTAINALVTVYNGHTHNDPFVGVTSTPLQPQTPLTKAAYENTTVVH